MSSLRTPNPWFMANRGHITIAATLTGALGIFMMWVGTGEPETPILQGAGLLLALAAFLGWAWMKNKTTPDTSDWLEYLEIQAAEEGHQEWLDSVQERFMVIWGLKSMKEVSE